MEMDSGLTPAPTAPGEPAETPALCRGGPGVPRVRQVRCATSRQQGTEGDSPMGGELTIPRQCWALKAKAGLSPSTPSSLEGCPAFVLWPLTWGCKER